MKKIASILPIICLFISSTPVLATSTNNNNASKENAVVLAEQTATKEDVFDVPGTSWSTYAEFREIILTQSGTNISKEELDTFSNEQLGNAFKLSTRYSYDLYGMDMGTYVNILKALYQTKLLDWNVIEPQLAFNPSDYATMSDLLPQASAFSTYLKALYPANSPFIPVKEMTVSELTDMMKKSIELSSGNPEDSAGKVAAILGAIEETTSSSSEVTPPAASTTPSTSVKSDSVAPKTTTSTSKPKATPVAVTKKKENQLPQTGEKTTLYLTILGISCLVIGSILLFNKKNAKKN